MDIFLIVWLVGMLTVLPAWLWLSINSRRKRGEPLIPKPVATARFCELRASGNQKGNPLARASNSLMVCVSDQTLWITPVFPFNLIAPYGVMGLEYRMALSHVGNAELHGGLRAEIVTLQFKPSGSDKAVTVNLRLTNPMAFMAAIANH